MEVDGRISLRPDLKDASLRSVLLPTSGHPLSVHCSWTLAYIYSMFRHSSSLSCGRILKEEVLSRLRRAGIDQSLIQEVDDRSRRTFNCQVPCIFSCDTKVQAKTILDSAAVPQCVSQGRPGCIGHL